MTYHQSGDASELAFFTQEIQDPAAVWTRVVSAVTALPHVRRQLRTVNRKLVFALPKGNRTRTVPLSPGVLAEIRHHMATYPPMTVTLP